MSDAITSLEWRHGDSQVDFNPAQLPLVIGTVSAADIRIAGPGGQTIAQIDLIDGTPFVQPLLRPSPMRVDGDVLDSTRTLKAGQQLRAFGVEIDIDIDDGKLTLLQHSRGSQFETLPPVVEEGLGDDAPIVAEQWQPSDAPPLAAGSRRGVLAVAVASLGGLLALVFWLTTAVALRLETTPPVPDSVSIEGPGLSLPIGGRWLLRRGVHEITLRSQGYADLVTRVDIDGSRSTLVLEQAPLPGRLVVSAAVSPAAASVTLTAGDGSSYRETLPAEFSGLAPGEYELAIEAPRYLGWSDIVRVTGLDRTDRLDVALVPDFARVRFATEPPGASISTLDGNEPLASATPAVLELAAGRHQLLFQLDGYKPVERTYVAFANSADEASLVRLEPADASLRVASKPAGASVTLDGRYRGRTPLTLALEPDKSYELRLTRQGYASITRRVSLPAAQSRDISIDLQARVGELTIRTVPADADIFINGRKAGQGTLVVSLAAEPQTITVRKTGYVEWQERVTPRPGFSQTVDARLITVQQAQLAKIEQQVSVANDHTLRYFRGGTFRQGTSRREADRRSNEPLHDVRITRAYYLGTQEVTNRQFSEFRGVHDAGAEVYASLAGDRNPVVNVTWQDAAAYCNWLSQKEGLEPAYSGEFGELVPVLPVTDGYRLPSEAEWVWAVRYRGRDGEPLRYGWGEKMPPPEKAASLADESAAELVSNIINGYRDGFPATAPVGSFKASAAGLFDIDGNVAEWMHDYYAIAPAGDGPQIDPFGPKQGSDHVIRGAGWRDANASRLRLAFRDFGSDARIDVGFRIARFAEPLTGAGDD